MKLIAVSVLFAGLAFGQGGTADTRFAGNAAMGGMTAVELGQLAAQKGVSDQVRTLGQRIVDDHTKADDQLKSLATKDNITLPNGLDARHQAIVDRFSKMSGTAFDRAFLRTMFRDHTMDIAAFRNEAENGSNMDLKNFASNNLSTLQDHLRITRDAERAIGVTSRTMPRK